MAKRQKRYDNSALIKNNAHELLGKKVNIVLHNGHVMFVLLLELKEDYFLYRNMRLYKDQVAINDIAEIILDF